MRPGITLLTSLLAAIVVSLGAAPGAGAADPPAITVSGNAFVAGGSPVRLIGVDRSGSEYACVGPLSGGGEGYGVFVGPTDQASVDALRSWDVNAVMLPLNEACWLGNYNHLMTGPYSKLNPDFTGVNYQQAVESYVHLLNANGIYVVLDLLGAAPGNNVFLAPGPRTSSIEIPMADADHSPAFWTSVATAFQADPDVLFHVYDEPNGDVDWSCLRDGCTVDDEPDGAGSGFGSYTAAGEQSLVNAIRGTGATQPILLSGINFDGDLSDWSGALPSDSTGQLGAVLDTFDYSGNFGATAPDDQSENMLAVAGGHPLLVGGFGEGDCSTLGFADGLMSFADAHAISYMAWTWSTVQDYGGCSNNALLDDGTGAADSAYDSGNPSGYGAGIRAHYQALAAESTSTSTSTVTSTSSSAAPATTSSSTTTTIAAPVASTTQSSVTSTGAMATTTSTSSATTTSGAPPPLAPVGHPVVGTVVGVDSHDGHLLLGMRCAGSGTCRGTLRLTAVESRRGRSTRLVTIANGNYSVPANHERRLILRATRVGATVLRGHRGRLRATLLLRPVAGVAISDPVTVKLPAK